MANKKVIWLLSSKDIQELNGDSSQRKICIHSHNAEQFDIFDSKYNLLNGKNIKISLGTFYYDLFKKSKGELPFIENLENDDYQIKEEQFKYQTVFSTLKEIHGEKLFTEILNFSIFRLKPNKDVFFTRSFPVELCKLIPLNLKDNEKWQYWLAAYIESVCRIMQIKTEEINHYIFKFLLHDKDIGVTKDEGNYKLNSMIPSNVYLLDTTDFSRTLLESEEHLIYTFQHDGNKRYYRTVILNSSFFDESDDPDNLLSSALIEVIDEF